MLSFKFSAQRDEKSSSTGISFVGNDRVVAPKPGPVVAKSLSPFPREHQKAGGSYHGDTSADDVSDDWSSEYCSSENMSEAESNCGMPPPPRKIIGDRSHVTLKEAIAIREIHTLSLTRTMKKHQHAIPLIRWKGGSPTSSHLVCPRATVPQPPSNPGKSKFVESFHTPFKTSMEAKENVGDEWDWVDLGKSKSQASTPDYRNHAFIDIMSDYHYSKGEGLGEFRPE